MSPVDNKWRILEVIVRLQEEDGLQMPTEESEIRERLDLDLQEIRTSLLSLRDDGYIRGRKQADTTVKNIMITSRGRVALRRVINDVTNDVASPQESRGANWRPWGDHPLYLAVTLFLTFIGIIIANFGPIHFPWRGAMPTIPSQPPVELTRASTPMPATDPDSPLVSDIWVATGKNYLLGECGVGDTYYIDDDYMMTNFSSEKLAGLLCIKTSNDGEVKKDYDDLLKFRLNRPAKIYIYYDRRMQQPPRWISEIFEDNVENRVYVSDDDMGYFITYSCDSQAGEITLGGALSDGGYGAKSMYVVAFEEGGVAEKLCTDALSPTAMSTEPIPTATAPMALTPIPIPRTTISPIDTEEVEIGETLTAVSQTAVAATQTALALITPVTPATISTSGNAPTHTWTPTPPPASLALYPCDARIIPPSGIWPVYIEFRDVPDGRSTSPEKFEPDDTIIILRVSADDRWYHIAKLGGRVLGWADPEFFSDCIQTSQP